MLEEIKQQLLENPEKLKEVLEHFGYCNIVIRPTYIQFGRDEFSSKKSIVIKLERNSWLYVHDYARNIQKDIFGYIIDQRKVSFSDVMTVVKNVLGIESFYTTFEKKGIFGGFYNRIKKKIDSDTIRTYDSSILNQYIQCPNGRFLRDHIDIRTQQFFDIRYDIESQTIVIPIYTQFGELMGVKARCNYDVEDGEQKYYYLVPCAMSHTLYGYAHNYKYLENNTVYILESEKAVMQCYSYGIRNCVALGSGTISRKQVKMLYELNPKKIILLHDVGYENERIMRNIAMIQSYSRFSEIKIGYWNNSGKGYKDKVSATDMGNEKLQYILANEIQMIGDDDDEEL